jgi:DHA1 family bicyclomycin/chloramphenicol resistance-like MFS transporter
MWSMIVPALPVLAKSFDISPGTAAQTITALAVGRFAGMPVSDVVLDRLGTRAALTAGPAIACSAALFAGFMPWFSFILVLVFLLGIGESIWVIAREVAGIDLVPTQQRGRVLSGFHGINNVGLALGPLIGGLLTETIAFRAVCGMRGGIRAFGSNGSQSRSPTRAKASVEFDKCNRLGNRRARAKGARPA